MATSFSYSVISAATTNAAVAKAAGGLVTGWYIMNVSNGVRYVRLYDKATAPAPATDVPVVRLPIPAGEGTNLSFASAPLFFRSGIALDITGGEADTDTTATAAGDVVLNLFLE